MLFSMTPCKLLLPVVLECALSKYPYPSRHSCSHSLRFLFGDEKRDLMLMALMTHEEQGNYVLMPLSMLLWIDGIRSNTDSLLGMIRKTSITPHHNERLREFSSPPAGARLFFVRYAVLGQNSILLIAQRQNSK